MVNAKAPNVSLTSAASAPPASALPVMVAWIGPASIDSSTPGPCALIAILSIDASPLRMNPSAGSTTVTLLTPVIVKLNSIVRPSFVL